MSAYKSPVRATFQLDNLKNYRHMCKVWLLWKLVVSFRTTYDPAQGGSNFRVRGWNQRVTIQMKATEEFFPLLWYVLRYFTSTMKKQ